MGRNGLASEELSHLIGKRVAVVVEKVIALRTIVQTANKQTTSKQTNKQQTNNNIKLIINTITIT